VEALIAAIEKIFTAQGSDLGPALVIPRTIIVFAVAILYVRIAKKRFIAQASAIDLVLAVVFGSLLSRAINGSGTLISCMAAGLTLVGLQRLLVHWGVGSAWVSNLVKGNCEVLVRDGVIDWEQMREHDISEDDLKQEMRVNGMIRNVEEVALAVLERSGQISVVKRGGDQ
jgi:uncharacterized membrane protein YcaP (DUF421 family)